MKRVTLCGPTVLLIEAGIAGGAESMINRSKVSAPRRALAIEVTRSVHYALAPNGLVSGDALPRHDAQ